MSGPLCRIFVRIQFQDQLSTREVENKTWPSDMAILRHTHLGIEAGQNNTMILRKPVPLEEEVEELHAKMFLLADIPVQVSEEDPCPIVWMSLSSWCVPSQNTECAREKNLLFSHEHNDEIFSMPGTS